MDNKVLDIRDKKELVRSLNNVDTFVMKKYLPNLTDFQVVPLKDNLANKNVTEYIRLYKIEKIVFENDEKEVIRGMLHKSVMAIMFGWYFKAVKSFFIHRYEHKNYEIIKILKFIKITKRSARLETIKRIRHLESLIVDISDKIDELKCTQSNKK